MIFWNAGTDRFWNENGLETSATRPMVSFSAYTSFLISRALFKASARDPLLHTHVDHADLVNQIALLASALKKVRFKWPCLPTSKPSE